MVMGLAALSNWKLLEREAGNCQDPLLKRAREGKQAGQRAGGGRRCSAEAKLLWHFTVHELEYPGLTPTCSARSITE